MRTTPRPLGCGCWMVKDTLVRDVDCPTHGQPPKSKPRAHPDTMIGRR